MADEEAFEIAYQSLAEHTDQFDDVAEERLIRALTEDPAALAPLRMILGFTYNELSRAMKLTRIGTTTSGTTLRNFERSRQSHRNTERTSTMIGIIAETAIAVMNRRIFRVPDSAAKFFHSKLDKRDTMHGWETVAESATGVPYSALLYQRYVGGVWRQVQDAYSEVKGDNLLE